MEGCTTPSPLSVRLSCAMSGWLRSTEGEGTGNTRSASNSAMEAAPGRTPPQ